MFFTNAYLVALYKDTGNLINLQPIESPWQRFLTGVPLTKFHMLVADLIRVIVIVSDGYDPTMAIKPAQ